jgi:hypothetical protein
VSSALIRIPHFRTFQNLVPKPAQPAVFHPPMSCSLFSFLPHLLPFTTLFSFSTSLSVNARYFPDGTSSANGPGCTRLIFST